METGGHFGQTTTHGEYTMLDTMVFLLPDSDDILDNSFGGQMTKLRYDSKSECLTDFGDHLYCRDEKQLYEIGEKRYEQRLKIKAYLLKLPEVEKYIRTQTDTTVDFVSKPKIEFDHVRTLGQRHFLQYQLMIANPERLKVVYSFFLPARMRPFLVDEKNLKIYREEWSDEETLRYEGQVPK